MTISSILAFLRKELEEMIPPTIFFAVGFNLILWTKRLILQEHGVEFSGFFTAIVAALLVGKAVLVTDNLPFMRRFDGAPMIQPILFKSAIYWVCVFVFRLAEGLFHFLHDGGALGVDVVRRRDRQRERPGVRGRHLRRPLRLLRARGQAGGERSTHRVRGGDA